MDTFTILAASTLILTVLCILFAIFLWTVPSQNKIANRFLGADLFVLALTISVFWYHMVIDMPYKLNLLRDDIGILNSPLSFLYIYASLTKDFKLRWKHLLHLTPLVLLLLFHWRLYTAGSVGEFEQIMYHEGSWDISLASIVQTLTSIIYISWGFIILYRKKQLILENYADDMIMLHKWLWQLNTYSLILFLISWTKSFLRDYIFGDAFNMVRIITVYGLISFIVWIVLKALYNPKIFRGVNSDLQPVSALLKEDDTAANNLSDADAQKLEGIKTYMDTEQPYLDSSLSLRKLAKQLTMPSQELSLLINHHLGRHFFDFINEYRIRAAQKILADPAQKDKTVLEILYEVGFNSKSSFNTAFKKHTDMTPTQYRKGKR